MNFSLDKHKGASYSKPLKPPAKVPTPRPAAKKDDFVLSIRINLPDYDTWRVVKFYRQYPYLGLMITAGILLGLGLLATLVTVLLNRG